MAFKLMDGRYMRDMEAITNALDAVLKMEPVAYSDTGINGGRKYGIVGDTVKPGAPLAACDDGIGMVSVDTTALIPVLVAAVKELAAKVDTPKRTRAPKAEAPKAE